MITFVKSRRSKKSFDKIKSNLKDDGLQQLMFMVATKFGYSEAKQMTVDELYKCMAFMQLEVESANNKT